MHHLHIGDNTIIYLVVLELPQTQQRPVVVRDTSVNLKEMRISLDLSHNLGED